MTRIQKKFKELARKNEKALIAFVTAGDPDLATTEKLIYDMEKAGADLIELGIPFSDPSADGPVIQRASERALKKGATLESVLKLVSKIRKKSQIPLILMGYYNPILNYGNEKFCKAASQAGVDALIVVDLPPEEAEELHRPAKAHHLHIIYLLTPTADEVRIKKVKKLASGFVYYVSMTGITGAKLQAMDEIRSKVKEIKQEINLPLCIGFGVRTPEDAKLLSKVAEGIVVGSALVSELEKGGKKKGPALLTRKVASLKRAVI